MILKYSSILGIFIQYLIPIWMCSGIEINQEGPRYLIMTPNVIKIDRGHTVLIQLTSLPPTITIPVKLSLKEYSNSQNILLEKVEHIGPGKIHEVKFTIHSDQLFKDSIGNDLNPQGGDFSNLHNGGGKTTRVLLTISSTDVRFSFKENFWIPMDFRTGNIFVLTDKTLYTPNEKVKARILNLDENLKSSASMIRIDVKNPAGIIVKRFDDMRNLSGIIDAVFDLPPNPKLGKWEITTYHGLNYFYPVTTEFWVRPYNLPSFTVRIKISHAVIYADDSFEIKIYAHHSYGIPVKGTVYVKMGVRINIMETVKIRYTRTKELKDGEAILVVDRKAFAQPKFPQGDYLYVEAIVTEKSSGNKETKIDASTRFSVQEYKIVIRSNPTKFKPKMPYYLTGKVIRIKDNSSAIHLPIDVSSFSIKKNGRRQRLYKSGINSTLTNSDGQFQVDIAMPDQDLITSIYISIRTALWSKKPEHQATVTLYLEPWEVQSKSFLQIKPVMAPLTVGQMFESDIITKNVGGGMVQTPIYYLVMCKGQIHDHGEIRSDGSIYKLKIQITDSLFPGFKILAYFMDRDSFGRIGLIADSTDFTVIRPCQNNVLIKLASENLTPGGYLTLYAKTSTPRAYISFSAIDKSVVDYGVDYKFNDAMVEDHLSSQDYGCKGDDQTRTELIFYSAGLSVVSNYGLLLLPRKSLECQTTTDLLLKGINGTKKRKRSLPGLLIDFRSILGRSLPEAYDCCKLGKLLHEHIHTDCQTTYQDLMTQLNVRNPSPDCRQSILKCCNKSKDGKDQRSFTDLSQLISGSDHIGTDMIMSRLGMERTFFPHTWLHETRQLNEMGKLWEKFVLPGTVTSWVLKTLVVSPTVPLCISRDVIFTTLKQAHLEMKLPNRIIRGEQILLQATAYNHGIKNLNVYIYMYGVDNLCSNAIPGQKSEKKLVKIMAKDSIQVTFPIIPLHVQEYSLKVEMEADDKVIDSVTKTLTVEPEGVRKTITQTFAIDPQGILNSVNKGGGGGRFKRNIGDENAFTKDIPIKIREKSIPGTEKCVVYVTGNLMGVSMINRELNDNAYRIKSSRYSGTILLANFALSVYSMVYLERSLRLTNELYKGKIDEVEKAYGELLEFRRDDGSFSTYINTPPSIWMTALTAKISCQATKYIIIDMEQLTCKALNWIVIKQSRDGSFSDDTLEIAMSGSSQQDQSAWLTAFVLIALDECHNCSYKALQLNRTKDKALAYISGNSATSTLILAPITYASILRDLQNTSLPVNSRKMMERLSTLMRKEAINIDTASYALLSLLKLGMFEDAKPYFHWLNHQINSNPNIPNFEKITALQALSQFVHNISTASSMTDIHCDLSVPNHPDFFHSLLINNENAVILQTLEAPIGETLSVNASGKGLANLNIEMQYNKPPSDELCQFQIDVVTQDIPINVTVDYLKADQTFDNRNVVKSHISKLRLKIKIVVSYLREYVPSGSVVVDVGLFSGMVPIPETLPIPSSKDLNLEGAEDSTYKIHPDIQHIQITDGSVYFYLEKVKFNRPFAIEFLIRREYIVGTIQQVPVRVKSYGNNPEDCTRFYHPSQGSPLLKTYCEGSMCTCFERDCAFCYGPTHGTSRALIKSELMEKVCLSDFAWIGNVIMVETDEQYKHITIQVQKILKQGIDILGTKNNRTLITRANCKCPFFKLNEDFLIIGSQPSKSSKKYNYILNNEYYVENMLRDAQSSRKADIRRAFSRLQNFEQTQNLVEMCFEGKYKIKP